MAILCGEMGDRDRQEKFYREAIAVAPNWGGPWFNLALLLRERRRLDEAARAADEAIRIEESAPFYVLRALIAESQSDAETRTVMLAEAGSRFNPVKSLTDWELGWYVTMTRMLDDEERAETAEEERRRRAQAKNVAPEVLGDLPDIGANLDSRRA